jgi:unsaturated chondroitin disaccharide hydrolase
LRGVLANVAAVLVAGAGSIAAASPSFSASPPTPSGYGLWLDDHRAAGVADNTEALRRILNKELTGARRRALEDVFTFARGQVDRTAMLLESRPLDEFPLRTDLTTGAWEMANVTYWTSGHWIGQLWELRRVTGDPRYTAWAMPRVERIGVMDRELLWSHDQGFLFGLSHVKAMPFVDDAARAHLREAVLAAADTYAKKQNPFNGLIHWHNTFEADREKSEADAIVDSMMNVPFLFWVSEETGESRWREAALRHVEAVRANLVRPDFSTAHSVRFDPRDGKILGRDTAQGYSKDSTWARGQAWAIHGFAVLYAKTGDRRYLETARGVADFYLANPHLPADLVPWWDFDAPGIPDEPRDSSAAAVTASALQLLARVEEEPRRAEAYLKKSIAMVESLSGPAYLSRGTVDQAILRHGCRNQRRGVSDNGLVFGDYYFLEALVRLLYW